MKSEEEGNIFILKKKVVDKLIKNNNFEELKVQIEKLEITKIHHIIILLPQEI